MIREVNPDTADELTIVITEGLLDRAKAEVDGEIDEATALRKVLLLLLAVTCEEGDDATRFIQDWILTEFKPIAGKFKNQWQDWIEGHQLARVQDGDHVDLLIPKALMNKILSEDASIGFG